MAGIGSIISPHWTRVRVFLPVAAIVFLLAFVEIGCGSNSFNYVGTWEGRREGKTPQGADPLVMNTLLKIKIVINPDGTFDMFEAGLPKSGNVYFGTEQATLRVTRIMDEPIAEYLKNQEDKQIEIALKPQKDGTVLYEDPNGFDVNPVILSRQADSKEKKPE